jgi:isopentenyl phosphate kinase
MTRYVFLKLGGSLITDKEKPYTVRLEAIKKLACQIKDAQETDKNLRIVIGNGQGSFAHYPAIKYKMNEGIKNENQKLGFCIVEDAAAQLNRIVVKELLKAGVKAIGLNPSSMIIARRGKIKNFFVEPIIRLLELGITPVIFGDIVFDEVDGAAIFSTEKILKEIAIRFIKKGLKIGKMIHAGITMGVFDQEGQVIPNISLTQSKGIEKQFYKTSGFDITGGMLHKVKESLILAKKGIKSLIINGVAEKDLLKRALLDEKVGGTLIG